MKIKIYESLDLVKDKKQSNVWILDIGRGEIPDNIHYDEVISASFYPIRTKLPAMLGKIAKYVKEITGQEWDWNYTVYVTDKESLKIENTIASYVVPYEKICTVGLEK